MMILMSLTRSDMLLLLFPLVVTMSVPCRLVFTMSVDFQTCIYNLCTL